MPVNVRSLRGAQFRLRKEPSYGVDGDTDFVRLNAATIAPSAMPETEQFVPQGAFFPTISILNDDFSEGDAEGVVDFNSIVFYLASWFGAPVITALGGGAFSWVFSTDGRRPNRPISYGLHYGFPDAADVITGWIFNTLGIGGGRSDGFALTTSGFGKPMTQGQPLGGTVNEVQTATITGTPTGGDFILSFGGESTTALLFSSAASAVDAALEALSSIGAGNVVVTGGPGPGTPYVITFTGDLAGTDVALITESHTFTGGTTPDIAVVATTPGDDVVVDIDPVPAGALIGDCYLDSSWANLGNTQLLYCYNNDLQLDARMNRVRPINSSLSSDTVIDNPDQEHTIELMLGANAVERARLVNLKAGTRDFIRLLWTGQEIAASGEDFSLQVDAAVLWTEMGAPEDQDGVMTRTVSGRIAIDTSTDPNSALEITVVCATETLSPTAA